MRKIIKNFFSSQIAIGLLLIAATVAALAICNSQNFEAYKNFFSIKIPLNIEVVNLHHDMNLLSWINDGLMAIFFLLVGLELKKEIMMGELSSRKKFSLPLVAACGGVIVPIAIYYFFNHSSPQNISGFAIPCATDIAFVYGVMALFGKKISAEIKVFIVALAVIDDLIAILIIAFFYSHNLNPTAIYLILPLVCLLAFLNKFKVRKISLYLLSGVILWLVILESGIHASIAGVILALFIPLRIEHESPLVKLAHQIAPVVNFMILPVFAFANAGVNITGFSLEILREPIVLGVAGGLFFGKQIGVMLSSFIAIKIGISVLPGKSNWLDFYKASIFTAIGFTMSLFIASLSFPNEVQLFDEAKIGILLGSFAAAIYAALTMIIFKK